MTTHTDTAGAAQSAGWRGKFAGFALGLSLFAVLWFAIAATGTKLGLWGWQFGLDMMSLSWGSLLVQAALALSAAALLISLLQAPRKRAFMLALGALLVAGLAYGRVAAYTGQAERLPPLHDVQTDWADPIRPSDALVTEREAVGAENPIEDAPVISEAANDRWPGMGGRLVSEVQEQAEFDTATHESPEDTPYPMLAPLVTAATPETAYAAALAAVEDRGWTIVLTELEEGRIEATEESFWFGFREDVMIRVKSDPAGARIDIRSTSRIGLSDLGSNAKRIRDLLDEIETRLGKGA